MKTQSARRCGPGGCTTTVALLVIAPLLYCASEWVGPAVMSSEPAPMSSRVSGKVVDAARNTPVAGASVVVWSSDLAVVYPSYRRLAVVESDADGEFAIEYDCRAGGVYRLSAQADEYDFSSVTLVTAEPRDNVIVTLHADSLRRVGRERAPRSTRWQRPTFRRDGVALRRVR